MSTGHLRQNISSFHLGKNSGKIEAAAGVMYLLFLLVFLYTQLQTGILMDVSGSMEDSLAAANLASAVIDIGEYGRTHKIRITDFDSSYQIFQESLKSNLNLDDEWGRTDSIILSGNVSIDNYIIYNVAGGIVNVQGIDENGNRMGYSAGLGAVVTPDGAVVEKTGIYSRISFQAKGFLGMEFTAQKSKLVDIASND